MEAHSPLMLIYRFAYLKAFINPDKVYNVVLNAELKEYQNIGQ